MCVWVCACVFVCMHSAPYSHSGIQPPFNGSRPSGFQSPALDFLQVSSTQRPTVSAVDAYGRLLEPGLGVVRTTSDHLPLASTQCVVASHCKRHWEMQSDYAPRRKKKIYEIWWILSNLCHRRGYWSVPGFSFLMLFKKEKRNKTRRNKTKQTNRQRSESASVVDN